MRHLQPGFAPLFDQVRAGGLLAPVSHPRPPHHSPLGFVARIGESTIGLFARAYSLLGFVGLVTLVVARLVRRGHRLRLTATVAQMEQTGVNALAIVGMLSFLVGVVIAYQGADQLRRFGAEIYTVDLLGVGVLRELGVLMTAIIIAGRSGSAFTAQIGTMRVNEEIDALRTLGLDPVEVLVIPRLLGLLLTLPMLTVYADLMGLLGGCLMAWGVLGITIPQFVHELQYAISPRPFWVGLVKAPFFAAIIAMIGCYEGFQVSRSAESVGRQTTLSVVESIFLVIVADAIFSVFFSVLGI
jgi:phospholipid/cholesterol/gamma-HCH transport system permease protein